MFKLNEKLKSDTHFIDDLKISQLLLMDDANYPWFILVPKKENLSEITDLNKEEQIELLDEINFIANMLKNEFGVEKTNIATLGNVVKQLHIHVVGRFEDDISFPKPVWGAFEAKKYQENALNKIINKVKRESARMSKILCQFK